MGLAGTKNKVKIGYDPRNTLWSNDTGRFGHKHLEKLGWEPGKGLGIESSGRKAMTSHVKISVKADNTGLGKKSMRKGEGDIDGEITTGLDVFQRLLGKLNGKSQESVDNQLDSQRKRLASTSKFGMVFVHGGYLRPEELSSEVSKDVEEEERALGLLEGSKECSKGGSKGDSKDKRSDKKRKRADSESYDGGSVKKSKKKESKKSDKGKSKKDKNDKKDRKDKKDKDKSKKKVKVSKDKKDKQKDKVQESSVSSSSSPKPSIPKHLGTRARWIAQKRAATMDTKSLNEIFMVKN